MSIRLLSSAIILSAFAAACSSSSTTTVSGSDAGGGGTDGGGGGGSTDGGGGAGGTSITGTLGMLGAAQPTVSSLVISNSGETLIYLSSAPITCTMLQTSRWLGSATAGSQVVELIVKGDPTVKTYPVPPAEVNYAAGGKSSAFEVAADSGSITFTKASKAGPVAGTFSAKYADGSDITGTFEAEFCAMGQGY